jgi:NRAMP (natural resistance-associated macrophage protein)-like metal ion transporter
MGLEDQDGAGSDDNRLENEPETDIHGPPDVTDAPAPNAPEAQLPIEKNPVRRFFNSLGPGLIAGASDDDPTAIATFTAAGASFGYRMLWTALLTLPFMSAIQYICAKVGLVSEIGLTRTIRRFYPRWVLYPTVGGLAVANVINAGVDIGAVAAGLELLVPVPPFVTVVLVTALLIVLLIWGSYRLIANVFRWLTVSLFAYICAAVLAQPDFLSALQGTFVPQVQVNTLFLVTLVAILATNLSPYLFFWQAIEEVEEEQDLGHLHLWHRRHIKDAELRRAALDINVGMILSEVVVYFICLAAAATLFRGHPVQITTAAQAAEALRPAAGEASYISFALGMIGSGLISVPVLAGSAAHSISEVLG